MDISAEDTICTRPDPVVTECDGEVVVLNLERGRCYGMNRVGSHIWRKLNGPVRVSDLIRETQSEFRGIDPAASGSQIIDFLQQLAGEGLIEKEDGNGNERSAEE